MKIIDNFLTEDDFKNLQSYIMSVEFPWYWSPGVSVHPETLKFIKDPLAIETAGLNHVCYNTTYNKKSASYEKMFPLIKKIFEINGPTTKILRIRMSLKYPKKGFTKDNYNIPHTDYNYPHKSLIYYINESDGDTFVFNEYGYNKTFNTFTVKQRVPPKPNTALILDGAQFHTASNPQEHDCRVIININYI
jgi:hypothetical protein